MAEKEKEYMTCESCNGTGKVYVPYSEPEEYEECRICKGEGQHER